MKWLRQIVESFERQGVRWCFLRESEAVWSSSDGEDIDVWCAKGDAWKLVALLADRGWLVVGGRGVSFKASRNRTEVIRFVHPDCNFVLELWVGSVRAGLVELFSENHVKRSMRYEAGSWYLSAVDQLAMITIRPLLLGRCLGIYQGRARRQFSRLKEQQRQCWFRYAKEYVSVRNLTDLERFLCGEQGGFALNKFYIYFRYAESAGFLCFVQAALAKSRRIINDVIPFRTNTLVTLIGVDGVGKSTLITKLASLEMFKDRSRVVYLGRSKGNTSIVRLLRKLSFRIFSIQIKESRIGRRREKIASAGDGNKISGWLKLPALISYFIEYWFRYLGLKRISFVRCRRYIFGDRGCLDLGLMSGLGGMPECLTAFLPRAHLSVFCHAGPEIILSRKEERDSVEIIRQQGVLGRAIRKIPMTRRLQISTENPIENCLEKIVFAISVVRANREGMLDRELSVLLLSSIDEPYDD